MRSITSRIVPRLLDLLQFLDDQPPRQRDTVPRQDFLVVPVLLRQIERHRFEPVPGDREPLPYRMILPNASI